MIHGMSSFKGMFMPSDSYFSYTYLIPSMAENEGVCELTANTDVVWFKQFLNIFLIKLFRALLESELCI